MKYVMLSAKIGTVTYKLPVIFPDVFSHIEVAEAAKKFEMFRNGKVSVEATSAGDVNLPSRVQCSGRSTTLKLESGPRDSEVINSYPYLHGVEP